MQFSRILSAAEHPSTRHKRAAGLAATTKAAARRSGPYTGSFHPQRLTSSALQPLYDSPYTKLWRSLHHFTLQIGNKTD
jgi:hypothetical protein